MTRVTIHSLDKLPVLYRDFKREDDAKDWAYWAAVTLPCIVEFSNVAA